MDKKIIDANVKLSDKNRELNYDLKEEKKIRKKAIDYILNKSIEYRPGYRKVDLNTKDCVKLLDILESDIL